MRSPAKKPAPSNDITAMAAKRPADCVIDRTISLLNVFPTQPLTDGWTLTPHAAHCAPGTPAPACRPTQAPRARDSDAKGFFLNIPRNAALQTETRPNTPAAPRKTPRRRIGGARLPYGGDACESNTPETFCAPHNGFEGRGIHQESFHLRAPSYHCAHRNAARKPRLLTSGAERCSGGRGQRDAAAGGAADGRGSEMQQQAAQPTDGAAGCSRTRRSDRRRSRRAGQCGGSTARRSRARRCSRPAWDRARPRCRRTPSAR